MHSPRVPAAGCKASVGEGVSSNEEKIASNVGIREESAQDAFGNQMNCFEIAKIHKPMLEEIGWSPPEVIVLGGRNAGKSTILERIAGLALFPIGSNSPLTTRMMIKVYLRHGPITSNVGLDVVETASGTIIRSLEVSSDNARQKLIEVMEEEVRQENNGNLTGICRKRFLSVRVSSPSMVDLTLVDLPPLLAEPIEPEHPNLAVQTRELVESCLSRAGQNAIILIATAARDDSTESVANQIVTQRGLGQQTIGILTKCDKLEAVVDTANDVETVAELLVAKVDTVLNQALVLHFKGYVVMTSRRPPRWISFASHKDVQGWVTEREMEWFRCHGLTSDIGRIGDKDAPSIGLDALMINLARIYRAHFKREWLPLVNPRLEHKIGLLKQRDAELGLPRAHDVTTIDVAYLKEQLVRRLAAAQEQSGHIIADVYAFTRTLSVDTEPTTRETDIWRMNEALLAIQREYSDNLVDSVRSCIPHLTELIMHPLQNDISDVKFGRFVRVLDSFRATLRQRLEQELQRLQASDVNMGAAWGFPNVRVSHGLSVGNGAIRLDIDSAELHDQVCILALRTVKLLDVGNLAVETLPTERALWVEDCSPERVQILEELALLEYGQLQLRQALEHDQTPLQGGPLPSMPFSIETSMKWVRSIRSAPAQMQPSAQPNLTETKLVPAMLTPGLVAELTQGLMSPEPSMQFRSTRLFRRFVSIEGNPPIQQVIDAGVVPRFVEFLKRDDNPGLQFEAAWALTNIAAGNTDKTRVVIEADAVPLLVHLLGSPDEDVREQATWALGNVAGDSIQSRDLVLQSGILPALLQLFTDKAKLNTTRKATWTLSNLCRGKPAPDLHILRPALPYLAKLVMSTDPETVTDACWALSYISDGPSERIQAVLDTGVAPRLVELLTQNTTSVQTPALRTIGNIVTGDHQQTQQIINLQALPALMWMLDHPKKNIRKEACWTISNITAGTSEQIQAVIEAGVFPKLIHLLQSAEFDIQKEAAWAVSSATSAGRPDQIMQLVQIGAIRALCEMLTVQDSKIITVTLEGIENILKVGQAASNATGKPNLYIQEVCDCGGLAKIERLKTHQDTAIRERAARVFATYLSTRGQ